VFQTNYAPALLLRGRIELADRKVEEAVQSFRQAAQINPLPEYQWALSEALRASGREAEAQAVATEIISRGPASDPRGCAVYLATIGQRIPLAERLAREESPYACGCLHP
jgi:tetratricopeptide (TPR) repeat protein